MLGMFSIGPVSSAVRAETALAPQTCCVTGPGRRTGGEMMFPCASAVAAKKVEARKVEACILNGVLKSIG